MFGPLVGEVMVMETGPDRLSSNGNRLSARFGDLGEIEIEDFAAEGMSEPITLTNIPHPANTSLSVAQATKSNVKAFGLEIDNRARTAMRRRSPGPATRRASARTS